ncbi:hypothetical protein F503_05402 [Ophiostoma piceae UAMH 11346]|uniref:Tat pathway signal sequence n=1 Tax=Ophiostoma piceae (strain UAMH 11346) TaxID=1262450 RepID=S3CBP9_OPHP1|nr:hypothetical protein F503_05402 [Ophiostoma piceae UAMH 11346]
MSLNEQTSEAQPHLSDSSEGQNHQQGASFMASNPQASSTPSQLQAAGSILPYQSRPLSYQHSFSPPQSPSLFLPPQSSFPSLFASSSFLGQNQYVLSAADDDLFVEQYGSVGEMQAPATPYSAAINTDFLFTPPPGGDEKHHITEAEPQTSEPNEIAGFLHLQRMLNSESMEGSNVPFAEPARTVETGIGKTTKAPDTKTKTAKAKTTPKSRAPPKTAKGAASKATKARQPAKNTKAPKTTKARTTARSKEAPEYAPESRLLVPPSALLNQAPPKWGNLEEIVNSGSAQVVAQAVKASRPLLATLAETINGIGAGSGIGRDWACRIQKLAQLVDATTTASRRLLIGVVGRTGTGKSSIINAVLDEVRVVPTNGLRACTAVVTEIAWNPSNNPDEKYMAEIEFVQPELWQSDVVRLHGDLTDELEGGGGDDDGIVRSRIALAKLRTVFPHHIKGKESIFSGECTVETLLADASVNSLLGTVQTVRAADVDSFYEQLKIYLDSTVIGNDNDDNDELPMEAEPRGANQPMADDRPDDQQPKTEDEMQLWPLIKVVRIYIKAEVLSTGVVLVDLPGFGDANLARDAVAEGYLSQCAALWIISPITRAVDDKEARALLDRSFKRQLVLDGSLSNLTFVCSKTDDYDVRETVESISIATPIIKKIHVQIAEIEASISAYTEKLTSMHQVQVPELMGKLKAAENRIQELSSVSEKLEKDVKSEQLADENDGARPKRGAEEALLGEAAEDPATKRAKTGSIDTNDDTDTAPRIPQQVGEEEAGNEMIDDNETRDKRAAELREQTELRDALAEQLRQLKECMKTAEETYNALSADRYRLKKECGVQCVQLRNDYSRKRIKLDFAQGQKELDEETAFTASGKKKTRRSTKGKRAKKPEPARDYSELARNLPVFCVSSRAYQRLRSENEASSSVSGFRDVEETEIPGLQQHAKKLSAKNELQRGQTILQGLLQVLASLSAWAESDGASGGSINFSEAGMDVHLEPAQEEQLNKAASQLTAILSDATDKFIGNLVNIMETKVLAKMNQLVQKSQVEAPKIVAVWARPRSKGGLMWQSYRAICRNKGNKTASKTSKSFNDELISTLLDGLLPTWTAAFNTKVPAALATYQTQMDRAVDRFHRELKQHCDRQIHPVLVQSARGVQHQLHRAVHTAGQDIEVFRKTVIQQPRACTCTAMGPVYESCAKEAGKGCLQRMRNAMERHVAQHNEPMYEQMAAQASSELAYFVEHVLPAPLPAKLGTSRVVQANRAGGTGAGADDDGAVHPDVLLGRFFSECRCMMGKAEGGVPETMQCAQESIREVLETVAAVFPGEAV